MLAAWDGVKVGGFVSFFNGEATSSKNFFIIYLFLLCWVFAAGHRLSLVAACGGFGFSTWASHHSGSSCCRAWALGVQAQ